MEFQFAANHSHNYLHTYTLRHTHTHGSWILSAGAEKITKGKSVRMYVWVSIQPINVAGGRTHLRAWHVRSTWPPKHEKLLYVKQNAIWLPQKSFCFQVEIGLVSKSLSETVFACMCVIIWEELRGSCWEDICVRAWHLTLDLWMEFTHTHSFQLLRRDHCHCYAASVLVWYWLMSSKVVLLLCQRQSKEEGTIYLLKSKWQKLQCSIWRLRNPICSIYHIYTHTYTCVCVYNIYSY